jgi:hypothetical protein
MRNMKPAEYLDRHTAGWTWSQTESSSPFLGSKPIDKPSASHFTDCKYNWEPLMYNISSCQPPTVEVAVRRMSQLALAS